VFGFSLVFELVGRFKATDTGRLRAEYNRLIKGLALRGDLPGIYDVNFVIFLNAISNLH
jgi:hypothetical protein